MNDEQLDGLIESVAPQFRAPPEAPLDEIWERISAQRQPQVVPRRPTRATTWWRVTGLAAAIAISFTLGRLTVS